MAFSKPLCKGQIPISCQLCEESNEIKWKCLQCDFLLCTKCQRLHKKVKSTDQHTIIDIRDIALHQQQGKDNPYFSNIPCEIHSGQICCLFCQTCYEVVCPLCIAKSHNKHDMIELAEGYRMTVQTINTFNSELNVKLTDCVKGISKLSSLLSSEDVKYEREKQEILSREKVLKGEVEEHSKKMLKELNQGMEHLKKSVKDEKDKSQKIDKDLEFRKGRLTKALASVQTADVFRALKAEQTARKQIIEPVNTSFKRLPQYIPGKMQIQEVLHGELAEPEDYYAQQYEAKVINQYKTALKVVAQIVCCDDGTLWIREYNTKNIQKIQLLNGLVHIVLDIQVYSVGMAILKSGDLLLSAAESNLKILSHTTGKITYSKYSVAPLITGPFHVTSDDRIIVRAREEGPLFPVNGPRQLVVMDIEGRMEKMYELDDTGKPIFTAIQRITTDTDNNIYVLDRLNENYTGRIVRLNKTNGVRWIYSGNPNINKEQTFKPSDLVASKLNNIIVIDFKHHIIHVLNTSGECIHYLNTKDQLGIELSQCLHIDNRGTLCIGCDTCQNEPYEAKIYTVQFSGF